MTIGRVRLQNVRCAIEKVNWNRVPGHQNVGGQNVGDSEVGDPKLATRKHRSIGESWIIGGGDRRWEHRLSPILA
jgi:hypothetical protein